MQRELITVAMGGGAVPSYFAVPDRGSGPGLVLFPDPADDDREIRELGDLFAEEGYVVLCPTALAAANGAAVIRTAVEALRARTECTGKIGALGFGPGGKLAYLAAAEAEVDCAVSYYGFDTESGLDLTSRISRPLALHFAEKDPQVPPEAVARVKEAFAGHPEVAIFVYAGVAPGFARNANKNYDKVTARLAHSRTIGSLRRTLGPRYDLEALWEKHTLYEFGTRDVDATMQTMVAEPYVNHVPTMTGGVGHRDLARFYAHHFIPKCPADFELVPVSRTIGPDRVVDEMVVSFTHDVEIDWMLPGIPPTGRRVEIPVVAIVNFRGDKLYHEHIYWDQASVLVQIGLLDAKALPVAGVETAKKLLDETRPSNTLMRRWAESSPTKSGDARYAP
ncbi:MAG: dienelactone hydrolase family protein [Stellaceae bacterium]